MNPTKTTPCPLALPLRVDVGHFPVIRDCNGVAIVKTDCSIAKGPWVEKSDDAHANAHALVTAANSLPGLVDVLDELVKWRNGQKPPFHLHGIIDRAREQLAALKAAGEEGV
jgi:hypothetical protein